MRILVFNCGSSSLSYKVFEGDDQETLAVLAKGKAHRVGVTGTAEPFLEHHLGKEVSREIVPLSDHGQAAGKVLAFLQARDLTVDAVGHRFVHGGSLFHRSTILDDRQMERLEACRPLAPIHNPNSLSVIAVAQEALPWVRQYVTFDTAFHADMPEAAAIYGLPFDLAEKHQLRKVGFHGISYQDVTAKTAAFLDRPVENLRMVACHLGTGGSSVAAIRRGRSVDTSMGYSPLQGLIMSTRSGDLDPTIPLYLVSQGYSPAEVSRILNRESGLLGISGFSSDMRDLIAAMKEGENERARLAFDAYVHRLKLTIGGMIASAGGLDALIFTDDVGLKCPEVREAVCENMEWCGIEIDITQNQMAGGNAIVDIRRPGMPVAVLLVPNDEERVIALEGLNLLR